MDGELRELERAARAGPSPAAWMAVARAYARAGREGEGYEAAVRAMGLDPAAPVRDLMPAAAGRLARSAPWPGLATLGASRTIVMPGRLNDVFDGGGGRLLGVGQGELAAFDVFRGEELWRVACGASAFHEVLGDAIAELSVEGPGGVEVIVRDAATGLERTRVRTDLRAGDLPEEPEDLGLAAIDERTVAVVHQRESLDTRVAWVDVPRGEVVASASLGPGAGMVVANGVLVVPDGRRLVGLGPDGRERFDFTPLEGGTPWPLAATRDGALLVGVETRSADPEATLVVLEPGTGRVGAVLGRRHESLSVLVAGDVVLTSDHRSGRRHDLGVVHLAAWSASGWGRLWERPIDRVSAVALAATRDVLLVSPSVIEQGWTSAITARPTLALDAATGEERWSRPAAPGEAPPRPLCGHLVVVGRSTGYGRGRTPVHLVAPG